MSSHAPGADAKAAEAEQGVARVRAALVAFNSVVYALWIYPDGFPALAAAVIVVANAYSLLVLSRPPHADSALAGATWTAGTDAALIAFWLTATGAAASPFFPLWGVSIIAVAFRFGAVTTRWVTLGYMVADAALMMAWEASWGTVEAVRVAYIGFLGMLGSYMASSNMRSRFREAQLARSMVEAADARSELEAVLRSVPSVIIRCDEEGRMEYLNRTVPGFDRDKVRGRSVFDFVGDAGEAQLRDAMAKARETGEPITYEVQGPGVHGEASWYRSRMGPVQRNGHVAGFVIVTIDITEEKQRDQADAEARKQAQELERLEAQNEFRKRLLNAVAHELNTPLTPLRLQLELLSRRLGEGRELALLRRNVGRLGRMVQDLLDVARIEGVGAQAVEQLDAQAAIDEVMDTFTPLAERRGVTLRQDVQATSIRADSIRLNQVLNNLVSNALKFTPEGGTVVVSVRDEGGGAVRVTDDGLGLDGEQIEQVQQPFEQVHKSLDPEQAGTGLGIFIVQSIMDQHGGTLHIESPGPGKGSSFTCTFPPA